MKTPLLISLIIGLLLSAGPAPSQPGGPSSDAEPYTVTLRRAIKRHWFPPKPGFELPVEVTASIAPDGHVIACRVTRPSRNHHSNESARIAVVKAAPFPPVPEDLLKGQPNLSVLVTIDVNKFPGYMNVEVTVPHKK